MANLFKQLLNRIPQAEQRFVDKQLQFAGQVLRLLELSGMKKIEFAAKVGIHPSQLTHVLSGEANPTLEFVTKLEAGFGKDIITFPLYPVIEVEPKKSIADTTTSVIVSEKFRGTPNVNDIKELRSGETKNAEPTISEPTVYYSGLAA